jgi:hypothetical protein
MEAGFSCRTFLPCSKMQRQWSPQSCRKNFLIPSAVFTKQAVQHLARNLSRLRPGGALEIGLMSSGTPNTSLGPQMTGTL